MWLRDGDLPDHSGRRRPWGGFRIWGRAPAELQGTEGRAADAAEELVPVIVVPKESRQGSLLAGDCLSVWSLLTCSGDTRKGGGS